MRKDNKGFFIIEIVFYVAISIFMINLLYSAIVYFNRSIKNEYKGFLSEASLVSMVSILNEDIAQANSNLDYWSIDSSSIKFVSGDQDVVWFFNKNGLYRKESGSRACALLKGLRSATFDVLRSGALIEGVRLKIEFYEKSAYVFNFELINGNY